VEKSKQTHTKERNWIGKLLADHPGVNLSKRVESRRECPAIVTGNINPTKKRVKKKKKNKK
jgi:hypothetical protein